MERVQITKGKRPAIAYKCGTEDSGYLTVFVPYTTAEMQRRRRNNGARGHLLTMRAGSLQETQA